jgi:hypothetical protein
MEKVYDFLGEEICMYDRAIMVQGYSHDRFFKKVTVQKIDTERSARGYSRGASVFIIADGNSVGGWTKPDRLIIDDNFNVQI